MSESNSSKMNYYLGLIEGGAKYNPSEEEALMAMAYANSLRSHCPRYRLWYKHKWSNDKTVSLI